MKHLVNSLKFDLHCPLEEQAFELRQEALQVLQPLLIDGIEAACAQHLSEKEHLRIEKLEIDLGRISPAELKEQFGPLFRQQFEAKLLECLSRIDNEEGNAGMPDTDLQLFFYFMQTGRLPWWAAGEEPDFETLCQRILQRSPDAVIAFFLRKGKAKQIWERVMKQLDRNFHEFLLGALEPFKEARLQLAYLSDKLRVYLKQSGDPLAAIVLDELQKLEQENRLLLLQHAATIFKAGKQQAIQEVMAGIMLQRLFPDERTERIALHDQVIKVLQVKEQGNKAQTITDTGSEIEDIPDLETTGPEKIMIYDAGLVLLGPYLKPFFTALGLWVDQQWTSDEARERAACLLRWMATGKKADKEYNLILEKILCSIPLYQPIYTGFEFTDEEIKEAETLLESVIAHWKALKNTSVAGFRASFLLREAVLYRKEEHWQMVVEKKTLDILLESIPWGYGTLSLPWNEYLIFTEW